MEAEGRNTRLLVEEEEPKARNWAAFAQDERRYGGMEKSSARWEGPWFSYPAKPQRASARALLDEGVAASFSRVAVYCFTK
jgi:hypothetical protein